MKTPEEIKKGLECCADYGNCSTEGCPYEPIKDCGHDLYSDALALIQQLERERDELLQKNQQLERERDAAVEDARRSNNCKICKHNKKWGGDCEGWSLCGYNMPKWQWRGVPQEVE